MTRSGSFPQILNEIFSDLMKAAHITIDYKGYPCAGDDDNDVSDIRIHSVNGFQTPNAYHDRIHFLCTKLVNDLMQAQERFQPAEKSLFLEKALERFEPLLHVVTYERFHPMYYEEDPEAPMGLYLFTYPNFTGDKYHEAPYYLIDRILCNVCEFSFFWDDAVTEVYEKLGTIAMLIEHVPFTSYQPQPTHIGQTGVKLRFSGTVPQLACFARILQENLFFNNINKSEICRVFIDTFQTKGRDDIAYHSFRNQFDSPQLDAIQFWQEECRKAVQYCQNLIDRYAA